MDILRTKQHAPAPVSIVIPSKGRLHELHSLLESINHQAGEVLIMIDGTDQLIKNHIAENFPYVKIFMSDKSYGPLYQRNLGASKAKHDIIIFFDDDVALQSDRTIVQTLQLFESNEIGAVTIPFFNIDDERKTIHSVAPSREGIYYTSTFYAGMVAFRKHAFRVSGGYREMFFMHVEESDGYRAQNDELGTFRQAGCSRRHTAFSFIGKKCKKAAVLRSSQSYTFRLF
jgi:glycosyltransferase involved in cell wall biosynthesis